MGTISVENNIPLGRLANLLMLLGMVDRLLGKHDADWNYGIVKITNQEMIVSYFKHGGVFITYIKVTVNNWTSEKDIGYR